MNKKKVQVSQTINKEKIIENALQKLETIENRNFETAKILTKYSLFDLAKKVLKENLKSDYDEVDFLCAISKYLFLSNINLIEQNQLETHKTIIKETKTFFKQIRKSLRKIESKFDETYLLYGRDGGEFYALDNAKLLDSFEELSQILNLTNKHKEAELAFDLRSKIELGFQRYFLHEKSQTVLSYFESGGGYIVANDLEVIEILEYFDLGIKPKLDFKTNNFRDVLVQLDYLKGSNKVEFNKHLKKYSKLLEFFSQKVYTKDEYNRYKRISISINKSFDENIMQLIKEKLVLVNPYDIESYNLVLKILK